MLFFESIFVSLQHPQPNHTALTAYTFSDSTGYTAANPAKVLVEETPPRLSHLGFVNLDDIGPSGMKIPLFLRPRVTLLAQLARWAHPLPHPSQIYGITGSVECERLGTVNNSYSWAWSR